MEHTREVTFDNQLAEISRLTQVIETFGDECGLTVAERFKIHLVLDELMTNIISYAYADSASHSIFLRLSCVEGCLTAVLTDDGRPFDPLVECVGAVVTGSLETRPIGGLGIRFVRTLVDEANYCRINGRNQITLTLKIGEPGAALAGR